MKLVVDANVFLSALIADSTTRELVVTLEPDLLTPETVETELAAYEDLITEKSGLSRSRVEQLQEILLRHVATRSVDECLSGMDDATEALGGTDPDDVPYLACAIAFDAGIWSDDTDFERQSLVPHYTTAEVASQFDRRV